MSTSADANTHHDRYFQRPGGMAGLVFILAVTLVGGILYSDNRRLANISGDSTTGKAVNALGNPFNPIPLGTPMIVGSGRIQVNSFQRDQSAAVEAMNSFNRDPGLDEEWVLLNITYFCDLRPDQSCNTALLRFELEGATTIYSNNFVRVLEKELVGSVPGGEQLSGLTGFIIAQAEENLLFVVEDQGNRVLFPDNCAARQLAGSAPGTG